MNMTDINCPMCGKENPADAEFCQHCQARLQPPGFVPPESKKPDEDTVLPEWLKRIRRSNPDYASQEDDNEGEAQSDSTGSQDMVEEDGTPEWLKRIRGIKSQEPEDEIYGKFAKPADESEQQAALQKGREFLSGGPRVETEGESTKKASDEPMDRSSQSYQDWLRELRRREYGDDYVKSLEQESPPADEQSEDTGVLSTQTGSASRSPVGSPDSDQEIQAAGLASTTAEQSVEGDVQTSKPMSAGSGLPEDAAAEQKSGKPLSRRIKDWFKGKTDKSYQSSVVVEKPVDLSEHLELEAEESVNHVGDETVEMTETEVPAQDGSIEEPVSSPKGDGWVIPDWIDKQGDSPSAGGETPASKENISTAEDSSSSFHTATEDHPDEQAGDQPQEPELKADLTAGSSASLEGEARVINESDQPAQDEDQLPLIPPYQPEIPGLSSEESGPLAGLAAIPAAQDFFPGPARKSSSSTRFELSEKDRTHALLLQSMLEGQPQPDSEKKPRKKSFGWLLKLVIAVALLTVMGYMLVNGVSSGPQGYTGGQAGLDFVEQIDDLPDGSLILVGAEYDAGYSAEIELAAVDVLRALIEKDSTLVLISTVPEGPILIEDLLHKGWVALAGQDQEQAADYVFSQRLINLGYLPGGSAALLAFMQNPQQAAPAGFHDLNRNQGSWTALSELGVNQLSDFSAVIVITDRFEGSRTWLEQVDPGLGRTPLLFITTAQSLPLLLPYVQSGQAQGLLAGINDGFIAGQSLEGAPGALSTVTSYQAGIYVLILLLLFGAFIQLLIKLFSRMFGNKEAG